MRCTTQCRDPPSWSWQCEKRQSLVRATMLQESVGQVVNASTPRIFTPVDVEPWFPLIHVFQPMTSVSDLMFSSQLESINFPHSISLLLALHLTTAHILSSEVRRIKPVSTTQVRTSHSTRCDGPAHAGRSDLVLERAAVYYVHYLKVVALAGLD